MTCFLSNSMEEIAWFDAQPLACVTPNNVCVCVCSLTVCLNRSASNFFEHTIPFICLCKNNDMTGAQG